VGERGEVHLADPAQQLRETGPAAQIDAQHERVDEETRRHRRGAGSARPAATVPITTSSPAPLHRSDVASAACTAMNSVAPHDRATSRSRVTAPASTVNRASAAA